MRRLQEWSVRAAAGCLVLLAAATAGAWDDDGWGDWYADRAGDHSDWADYYGQVASWYAWWNDPGSALYYEGLTEQQSWVAGWYSSYDTSDGWSDWSYGWSQSSSGWDDDVESSW